MSSRRYLPLEEYGLVGDGRSAALVGRDGSVDWWCPPRFDAPSVFARLLDDRIGGFCSLAPAGAVHASPLWESSQRYRPGTCLLVTEFRGADARLEVTDLMPWPGPETGGGDRDDRDAPTLLRRVEARGGPVEAELRFAPRFDYARTVPEYRETAAGWLAAGGDGARLALTADSGQDPGLEVDGRRDEVSGRFRVEPGRPRWIALRWGVSDPGGVSAETCRRILEETAERWRRRAGEVPGAGPVADGREQGKVSGPGGRDDGDGAAGGDRAFADRAREAAVRSALTLDLLTHLPTGGVVRAATTSLPGAGPLRDGRRLPRTAADATTVLAALTALERRREARRLCRRLAGRGLGTRGDSGRERVLEHLHGYEGSRPVRVLPADPSGEPSRSGRPPEDRGAAASDAAAPGGDRDGPGPAADGGGARPLVGPFEEARDLALAGRPEEAKRAFEAAAGRAGPPGLLAEAVDPESGRLRGNVPSAAAHAALVEAARVVAAASCGELRTTRTPSP